jgi:hypothetical protein
MCDDEVGKEPYITTFGLKYRGHVTLTEKGNWKLSIMGYSTCSQDPSLYLCHSLFAPLYCKIM